MPLESPTPLIIEQLIPENIRRILGPRPLLGNEKAEDFDAVHIELLLECVPVSRFEHLDVKEMAVELWDTMRMRAMRNGAIEVKLPAAATRLIGQQARDELRVVEYDQDTEIRFQKWLGSAANGNKEVQERLEGFARAAGVTYAMIQYEAYSKVFKTVSTLDEAISRSQRRFDQLVSRYWERRKSLEAMERSLLKRTAQDIDANPGISSVKNG